MAESQFAKCIPDQPRHNVFFGFLAMLGVFPLLAFLVIGLGRLMGDYYWLSSLIVAVLCMGIGGSLAIRAYHRMKEKDLTLPHTRETLDEEIHAVDKKLHQI